MEIQSDVDMQGYDMPIDDDIQLAYFIVHPENNGVSFSMLREVINMYPSRDFNKWTDDDRAEILKAFNLANLHRSVEAITSVDLVSFPEATIWDTIRRVFCWVHEIETADDGDDDAPPLYGDITGGAA